MPSHGFLRDKYTGAENTPARQRVPFRGLGHGGSSQLAGTGTLACSQPTPPPAAHCGNDRGTYEDSAGLVGSPEADTNGSKRAEVEGGRYFRGFGGLIPRLGDSGGKSAKPAAYAGEDERRDERLCII
ncbi:hypothetical protein MTO96_012133 [Rhipicephalus appendiculatus]